MEALRRAHRLTCLLLAWFVVGVGAAIAAPVLQPAGLELICSGAGGMKMMVTDDTGVPSDDGAGHMKDCRQCVMTAAPPSVFVFTSHPAPAESPVAALPRPLVVASAAPLSARGPPV